MLLRLVWGRLLVRLHQYIMKMQLARRELVVPAGIQLISMPLALFQLPPKIDP